MANRKKATRKKRSLTPKGQATRAAILDAAHKVFEAKGFFGCSISEVTRRCKISMGTFYQYFKNKEQVFQELNDLTLSTFLARTETLSMEELSFPERLRSVIDLLYSHTRDNLSFNRVLGESELIDSVTIAYYEAIARYYRDFFRKEAAEGNIRSLDPNVIAYGLIGICYFLTMDWGDDGSSMAQDRIVELISDLAMNGVNGPAPWKKAPGWHQAMLPETGRPVPEAGDVLTKGEMTRKAILLAAEKVFGRHGINHANIGEITREAGVAQGTFYNHFKSKTALTEGFVKFINRQMRHAIQGAVTGVKDRRDIEWKGMLMFYEFISHHQEIYRIVPEYELIGRDVSLWYYNKFSEGYIEGLDKGIKAGQIRDLPVEFLARALMGFTHFVGLKWIIWAGRSQKLPIPLFKDIREFIIFGLGT